ncbi:1906_t:CDS:2 [Funneliformis caledonium]|uniref:1906_t:CDS:1 n=1 Tax=Funneliformis caledonium TaxID=1117310 RepID=A0A9N9N823_9GLOM|nr:1906_t:CDS:2 [Funneliformis caledonium]
MQGSKRTLITLLISISLTASPELISLHNQGKIISSTNSKEILVREIETFVVEINGISCEGCANRIKAQFDSKPFVIDSKVYFKNQSAIVSVKSGTYNSNDIETWVKMVDFKYGAKVIQQYIKTVEEE